MLIDVNRATKDFTPKQFLGDIENTWMGTLESLWYHALENAPETIDIDGHLFSNTCFEPRKPKYEGKKCVIVLDYQSTEQLGNIYPVLQVGIRVWRGRNGKVKSEIIRDGYVNETRLW